MLEPAELRSRQGYPCDGGNGAVECEDPVDAAGDERKHEVAQGLNIDAQRSRMTLPQRGAETTHS